MTLKNSSHLKSFQKYLAKCSIEACLIESHMDLFYLTGVHFSAGSLIVTPKAARLFVDGRYIEVARQKAPMRAELLSDEKMTAFLKKQKVKKLAFDKVQVSYSRYLHLRKLHSLKGVASPLKALRMIKGADEKQALRKSAILNWKAFLFLKKHFRLGVSEEEIVRELEIFYLKNGGEGVAFDPIISFGKGSAMPHYVPGKVRLKKGDIILVDMGVIVDNYHSDMTRVLFFGPPKPRMKKIYDLVHAAQKCALGMCRPGVKIKLLDDSVRKMFRSEKLLSHYPHGLGHGVGLDVHEAPRVNWKGDDKDLTLQKGMVITIEPGLYFPGFFGVRYEDTIIITDDGYENLYPNIGTQDTILLP